MLEELFVEIDFLLRYSNPDTNLTKIFIYKVNGTINFGYPKNQNH